MRRSTAPSVVQVAQKAVQEAEIAKKLEQGIDPDFQDVGPEGRSLRRRNNPAAAEPQVPLRDYIDITGKKKRKPKKKDGSDEEEEPELEPDDEEMEKKDVGKENDPSENFPRHDFDDALEASEGIAVKMETTEKKKEIDESFFEVQYHEKKKAGERKTQRGTCIVLIYPCYCF